MNQTGDAIKLQRDAQRLRALAPEYDPVRCDFDLGLANEMEREAQVLLTVFLDSLKRRRALMRWRGLLAVRENSSKAS